MDNLWQVREDSFDPNLKHVHSQETVFTIGNGYFCSRGTFEESYPRATPATLLYGVFDSVPMAKEELANAPDWLGIKLFVNGERFRLDRGKILDYQRILDMQNGVITRTVRWEGASGTRIKVVSERFASLADEHAGIIRYSVTVEATPDNQAAEILLRASLNLAQGNYNVLHWDSVDQSNEQELSWLLTETQKTGVRMAQTISFTSTSPDMQKEIDNSDIAPSIHLKGKLNPGATLLAEKVLVLYTTRDDVDPLPTALKHHATILGADGNPAQPQHNLIYNTLFEQHQKAWQEFWEQADVVLEGDDKAQIALRYSIYQLRISTSSHDSRYSIAAKGLTGFGYRGHIFHDTEVFMLPFFIYVLPDIARNLLLYRYNLLPAARKKAASHGYSGAQYPWESTLDGEEATPPSIIHPENGEVIPVLNGFIEIHITSSIAYAVGEYWRVTSDDAFMRDYGAEMLLSTALFWDSRAEKNKERQDYEISDVIGPDEWHEHVNNNAHTNYMARHNIQLALSVYEWLEKNYPEKAQALEKQLKLSDELLAHMRNVQEHIRLPYNPETGLIEQFDGFFKLKPLDQSKFVGRKDSYQGILGVEEVQQYQIVKQADTLMMLTMLRDEFDNKTKQANWDYYYPITDHEYGSSLTPALHVILGSKLGHSNEALRLFMMGAQVDLENLRGNTPEGVHDACAGAVWQATIFGYAGLKVTDDGYTTNPHLPTNWKRLAFRFMLRGKPIYVDLHNTNV